MDNNLHGIGVYKYVDGRELSGSWEANQIHGQGKQIYPDGKIYEGNFVHD